jgi:uncharacterized iron-regulated membrane protein
LGNDHALADLGTALGDWMANSTGRGYEGGALVFAVGLAFVAVAYYFSKLSHALLFWAAFILARPLGGTVGDFLDKPLERWTSRDGRPSSPSLGRAVVNPTLRRGLVQLHRWLALIIAPAIAYLALTGTTMLLRPHFERVVDKGLHAVSVCGSGRLSLDRLIANARANHPAGSIRQIEMASDGVDATVMRYNDLQGVYVDPCSGAVLGQQRRWGGLFGTLEGLHRFRWFIDDGNVTEPIGGTLSVVLALIVAIGLALWWPRSRQQLKRTLSLRSRLTGTAFEMHLHRVLGVYAAIVLLVSATAAWTFTFAWARTALYAVTLSAPPAARPQSAAPTGLRASPEALVSVAQRVVPNWGRITLVLAKKPGDPVEVQIIEQNAPHPNARTTLYLDAGNGQVLRLDPYATSSAGHKAYRWLASLHMGYVGGFAGQFVQAAAMLTVPILLITGLRSYLRRRRQARGPARTSDSLDRPGQRKRPAEH